MEERALENFPTLNLLLHAQIEAVPAQKKFLEGRFQEKNCSLEELEFTEQLAEFVEKTCGDEIGKYLSDCGWICDRMLEEELRFRRSGQYRFSSFADAVAEVYSDPEFMSHYMRGLLMTELWWKNHTRTMQFFIDQFLLNQPAGLNFLEVGPGHGLFLYLTLHHSTEARAVGWDISSASVEMTRRCLSVLKLPSQPELKTQDLFEASEDRLFDRIIFSEVVEHLENPREAMAKLRGLLAPNGRLFLNVPVNSPAPDHIFLLKSIDEVTEFVESCGFEIESSNFEGGANLSLEQAIRTQSTISCALILK